MRPSPEYREKCSTRAKRKNEIDENERLRAALEFGPIRAIHPVHIGELYYRNPRTGTEHSMDLWHEPGNGNDRYTVYFDGKRWPKQWSRTGLINWLFDKIESVRSDWD